MKTSHFLSYCDIKMTIMTSYFRIRDDIIKIVLDFTRFLPIAYSYQVSAWSDLNQKKFSKNLPFDHVFSQALPPLICYHGNNELPILKILILKDDLCNGLKSHKVSWRSAEPFLGYLVKALRGPICPLPPSPNRVNSSYYTGPFLQSTKESHWCNFFQG